MDIEDSVLWSPVHDRKLPLCREINRRLAAQAHKTPFNLLLKETDFRQAERFLGPE